MKKVGVRLDEVAFAALEARAREADVSPTTLANKLLSEIFASVPTDPRPENESLLLILERLDELDRKLTRPTASVQGVAPRRVARKFDNPLDAFVFDGIEQSAAGDQDELDFDGTPEEEDEGGET